ncbi:MAG: hypothetical protein ACI93R_003591 [Flavobacteriales bacterium]|jgi:hypothetical protein
MKNFLKICLVPLVLLVNSCVHRGDLAEIRLENNNVVARQAEIIGGQLKRLDELSKSQLQLIERLDEQESILSDYKKKSLERSTSSRAAFTSNSSTDGASYNDIGFGQIPFKTNAVTENNNLSDDDKVVLGRVEWVWLSQFSMYLKSRVDTGAKLSSIHAESIQVFERDGEKWVRFSIAHDKIRSQFSEEGDVFETPLLLTMKVRQASQGSEVEIRPVIELALKVGKIEGTTRFTLSDRGHMNYPVLLGRSFLKDIAVVDVARSFVHKRKLSK